LAPPPPILAQAQLQPQNIIQKKFIPELFFLKITNRSNLRKTNQPTKKNPLEFLLIRSKMNQKLYNRVLGLVLLEASSQFQSHNWATNTMLFTSVSGRSLNSRRSMLPQIHRHCSSFRISPSSRECFSSQPVDCHNRRPLWCLFGLLLHFDPLLCLNYFFHGGPAICVIYFFHRQY
jgi:hypothetical protein